MTSSFDSTPLMAKLATAGTAACIADFATFPLDTAKVRLQVQGEVQSTLLAESRYNGMLGTLATITKQEGLKSLYNGLSAGMQRQMCFASIRIGLYEPVKGFYQNLLDGSKKAEETCLTARITAGITTGGLAVLIAQPTDVVKVRLQAQRGVGRYSSTIQAYRAIAKQEGAKGLWRGLLPNVGRNSIVNVSEIVCYDVIKDSILRNNLLRDNIFCHFVSALIAGLCTTLVASPIDVVKTRYMNAPSGDYRGAIDCSIRMMVNEGPSAFYKGFTPSFCRLVSWNIAMWITYEQLKRLVIQIRSHED